VERIIQEDQKKRGESLGSVNYHPGRPEKARRESGKCKLSSRKTRKSEERVWEVERIAQEDQNEKG